MTFIRKVLNILQQWWRHCREDIPWTTLGHDGSEVAFGLQVAYNRSKWLRGLGTKNVRVRVVNSGMGPGSRINSLTIKCSLLYDVY